MNIAPLAPKEFVREEAKVQVWQLTNSNLHEVALSINGMGGAADIIQVHSGENVLRLRNKRGQIMFKIGAPRVLVHDSGRWYKVPKILFEHWHKPFLDEEPNHATQ